MYEIGQSMTGACTRLVRVWQVPVRDWSEYDRCLCAAQAPSGWSVFEQIFDKLRAKGHATDANWFHWVKTNTTQWWKVKFVNEGVIDQGGGFRESVSTIAEELMSDRTSLFVPVPDAEDGISFHRCAP